MFESFYEKLEPADRRPPHPVRVQRHARRFERVLESDMTVCTKAVLAEPHGEAPAGELVGIAVWHRPGALCVNPKRRSVLGDEYHGDAHAWQHVDMDKYEQIWTEWDDMRQSLMAGKDHWCRFLLPRGSPCAIQKPPDQDSPLACASTDLCPIWVKNEYQGCGIGKLLMQEILDKCDKHSPPTAVYLEATPEGAPLYKKLGFVEVGKSEYVEMARWNKDGRVAP